MLNGLIGNQKADLDVKGSNDFDGKGGASAKNTFTGTMTVTVAEVLANGNLKVVGEKQIAINQGTETSVSQALSTRAPSTAITRWCPRRWRSPHRICGQR